MRHRTAGPRHPFCLNSFFLILSPFSFLNDIGWEQKLLEGVEEGVEVEPFICGEAVFGACCVDDVLSKMLGADAIVHFGHSEIVPRSVVCGKDGAFLAVYVPVTSSQWSVEAAHDAIAHGIPHDQRLAVVSTVQFVRGARQIADMLRADGRTVDCPTIPGLSQGEILGCTAPTFAPGTVDAIVFVFGSFCFSPFFSLFIHCSQTNTYQICGRWTVPPGGSNACQPAHTNFPVRSVHWALFT